ncbi:hypothetical protein FQN55_009655 [Onygenales sp. PD_40]|nr:hypothetical protein FQN55_009655 [Onygenales sp. PD_40]KAK2799767.1 hypothetical protein FQN51_006694 [Onygenales sp. PD_10]
MASVDPQTNTGFTSRVKETGTSPTQERLTSTKSEPTQNIQDPFAGHRTAENDPFGRSMSAERSGSLGVGTADPLSPQRQSSIDRRLSKEWDAAKVPPSRFQKREGSIFSTAGSRDSHLSRRDRDSSYHAKLKEKGWA